MRKRDFILVSLFHAGARITQNEWSSGLRSVSVSFKFGQREGLECGSTTVPVCSDMLLDENLESPNSDSL